MDPTTDEQPAPPPLWSEVKASEGFDKLAPEKQLVAFSRWHDEAYNHLTTQPDWAQNQNAFNVKAAQEQTRLSAAAGGKTPDQARAFVARTKLYEAAPEAQGNLSPAQEREVLRPLGPDVWNAYYNSKTDGDVAPRTTGEEFQRGMYDAAARAVGAVTKSLYATAFGFEHIGEPKVDPEKQMAAYDSELQAKQQMLTAMPPDHPDKERLGNEIAGLQADRGNREGVWNKKADDFKNDYQQFHDTMKNIDPMLGVDPKLHDDVSGTLAEIAAGAGLAIAEGALSGPLMMMQSGLKAWAEKADQTGGDTEAADKALRNDLITNLVFMNAAHGSSTLIEKAIKKVGGGELIKLGARLVGSTGSNIAIGQGIGAANAADDAAPGEKWKTFKEAMTKPDLANISQGIAFGVLGAKPIESIQKMARTAYESRTAEEQQTSARKAMADLVANRMRSELAPEVDALRTAGAPETAKVVEQTAVSPRVTEIQTRLNEIAKEGSTTENTTEQAALVQELAVIQPAPAAVVKAATAAPAAAAPEIRVRSHQGTDGSFEHTLDISPTATAEQIRAFADKADLTHLPEAEETALRAQLEQAAVTTKAIPAPVESAAGEAPAIGPKAVQFKGKTYTGESHDDAMNKLIAANPDYRATDRKTNPITFGYETADAEPRFVTKTEADAIMRGPMEQAVRRGAQPVESAAGEAPQAPLRGPALVDAEGNILVEGKIGETHADLMRRGLKEAGGDTVKQDSIIEAASDDTRHVFVDANGATHNRTEGAKRAVTAGQAPEGTTRLQSQDLQEAPAGDAGAPPRASTLNPDRPLPAAPAAPPSEYEVAKQAFLALPQEERDRQITGNRDKITADAMKSGIVPRLGQIRADAGKGAREFWDALKAKLAEAFPAEPLPEGAKEVQVKVEGGKEKLPAINEDGKVRPKFTNDSAVTAKQLDVGAIGTGEGQRLYIPNEIMDAEKLNPAINPVYDPVRKQYYAESVKHEFGEVHKAGDLAALLKENETEGTKAHQMVFVGDPSKLEALAHGTEQRRGTGTEDSIGQQLHENGDSVFKDTKIEPNYDAVDVESNEIGSIPASSETPTAAQLRKMTDAVKQIGMMTGTGKARANAVGTLIDQIRTREINATAFVKTFADMLAKSGIDLSKIAVDFVNQPNKKYAAHYLPNAADVSHGKITINLAVAHEGGVVTSVLHELVHHTTLVKLDPNYKRTVVEQRAMDSLQKLYDHASAKAYENIFGKEGTPAEIERWQKAQRSDGAKFRGADAPERAYDRSLYQFSGLHEFVTEAITNPKAGYVLENIEGLPGFKSSNKGATLLQQIYQHIKEFVGNIVPTKGSVLDQSLDHILNIGTTAAKHSRAGDTIYADRTETHATGAAKGQEDLSKLDRVDLAGRVLEQDPSVPTDTFTKQELIDYLQPTHDATAESRRIHGPGLLGPDGKFHAASSYDAGVGFHDSTSMVNIIQNDPRLAAKWDGSMSNGKLTKFLTDNGYARVTTEGGREPIYVEGKLTNTQRRALVDHAIDRGVQLIHDLGNTRQRLIHDPDAFTKPADPTEPRIVSEIGPDGKTEHRVDIPAFSTAEGLRKSLESVQSSRVPDAAKAEMTKQLQEKLGTWKVDDTAKRFVDLQEKIAGQPNGATPEQAKQLDAIKNEMPEVVDHAAVQRSGQALGIVPGFVDIHDTITKAMNAIKANAATFRPTQVWGALLNAADTERILFTKRKVTEMRGTLREALSRENAAPGMKQTAKELLGIGKDSRKLSSKDEVALSFVIEAQGAVTKLAEFTAKIQAAKATLGRSRAWFAKANEAIFAIEHATANWTRFQAAAPTYTRMMQDQVRYENNSGLATNYRDGYVNHIQDLEISALDTLLNGGAGGTAGIGFKKMRTHDTFADSIAAGVLPKTLNAIDAMGNRINRGMKSVSRQEWAQNAGKNVIDPNSGQPLVTQPITQLHPVTKETQQSAPDGYVLRAIGGHSVAVLKNYAAIYDGFLAPSAIRANTFGNTILQTEGAIKHGILLLDVMHVGRLAFYQMPLRGSASFQKGLLISDYSAGELQNMERRGELPSNLTAADVIKHKADLDLLVGQGYNVGSIEDALNNHFVKKIPLVGPFLDRFNKFVFQEFQRGGMVQTGVIELNRQRAAYPELSEQEVARKVSHELNVRFGNLGKEGAFANETFRDIAQLTFLAPSWNEGLLRSEAGMISGVVKTVKDATVGVKDPTTGNRERTLRADSLVRGGGTLMLGTFIMGQIINLGTRGIFTWQNPEEGISAKLSAYIPDLTGDGPGFMLNPLTLPTEYISQITETYHSTHSLMKSVSTVGSYKLSPVAQAAKTFVTREDKFGKALLNDWAVAKEMITDVVPVPLGPGTFIKAGARGLIKLTTGQSAFPESSKGETQKQAFASGGVKLSNAQTPVGRMSNLAKVYLAEHGLPPKGDFGASPYAELGKAVANHDPQQAKKAFEELAKVKSQKQIDDHFDKLGKRSYTGNKQTETAFYDSLTPEQKKTYDKSLDDGDKVADEYFGMKLVAPEAPET